MNVAVLIPAYHEELRIREVVEGALRHCSQVIVVDDGSSDGTRVQLDGLPVQLLVHAQCRGKGESLRHGFRAALALGVDGVLTMDGDGQHSAADIPRLLEAASRHPRHIVIGARVKKRSQQPILRRLANEFGDWGIAWACGYRIIDTQSGQRYYPARVAALGDVPGEDFVFEAQILISAARLLGTRCVSVPIESRYQCAGASADDPGEQFRASHFRPMRDFGRITCHLAMQILRRGGMLEIYRGLRDQPPLIDDPSGEFATAPPPKLAKTQ
ncbi:MAG: glycosyltransferase family 2 protein [Proteobacteria bacterium]|nr:glycosyltransferase family 2 protein [Pseudomonadota bacterium]